MVIGTETLAKIGKKGKTGRLMKKAPGKGAFLFLDNRELFTRNFAHRVLFLDGFFQFVAQHVGVNLRGCDIGVAQHFLHRAQIGAIRQQVRGKGVTQDVWRYRVGWHAGIVGQIFQQLGETLTGQVARIRRT